MSEQPTISVLILGGTGLVGSHLIQLALGHPRIKHVIAPTRRPLAIHERLHNPLIDFDALPSEAPWWEADAVLCALGTTRRLAGSEEQFRRVDHDYVLQTAALTRHCGAPVFVFNSSLGADANSRSLYLRTKGETEMDLEALGFSALTHVRPSLLDGEKRTDFRPGESIGLWLARRFEPLIPARYKAVSTRDVAVAMLNAALEPKQGVQVIESDQIRRPR
jgi:uncharacterized protein YbjT (DUF2867 family)